MARVGLSLKQWVAVGGLVLGSTMALQACSDDLKLPDFADIPTCQELGVLEFNPAVVHPDDGCIVLPIAAETWEPFAGLYRPDTSDSANSQPDNPILQLHDRQSDKRFCVDIELFPRVGTWQGQEGQYELSCESGGLCAHVYPDEGSYVATAGQIIVTDMPDVLKTTEVDGKPFDVTLNAVTFGNREETCFHVDTLSVSGTLVDLSATLN